MPTLKNINPIGEVDLPLLGRCIGRDEEFDVTEAQAAQLLMQEDNYATVKAAKAAPAKTSQEG